MIFMEAFTGLGRRFSEVMAQSFGVKYKGKLASGRSFQRRRR